MSFRARLALASAAAVAIAVAVASFGAYVLVRDQLVGELDRSLRGQVPPPREGDPGEVREIRGRFGGPGAYVQLVDSRGNTYRPREALVELPVTELTEEVLEGGDRDEARRPADPLSSPLPKPTPGVAPRPLEAGAPRPTPATPAEVLTQKQAEFAVATAREAPESPQLPKPTAQELIEKNAEMAQLAQEYQRQKDSYAKRPKKKFLSANTKEYAYASYLAGWAARIERIGNLNYPDEARRQKLHGDVLLTVTHHRLPDRNMMLMVGAGWHMHLDVLVARATGRETEPFWDGWVRLKQEYDRRLPA